MKKGKTSNCEHESRKHYDESHGTKSTCCHWYMKSVDNKHQPKSFKNKKNSHHQMTVLEMEFEMDEIQRKNNLEGKQRKYSM